MEVTDGKGNPVKALVNVNLVDEALYALKDQHVDILGRIYQDTYYSGIKTTHYTHDTPEMLSGGAEKGGEGGSERWDFKYTVIFKTLTINKQGSSSILSSPG